MKKTFAFGVLVSNEKIIAARRLGRLPNPRLGIAESDVAGLSFVYHKDSEDSSPTVSASAEGSGITASIVLCPEDQAELLRRTFPAAEISRRQLKSSPPSD